MITDDDLMVHAKWLRKCAEEIAEEGHYGWGNTCLSAAEAIERHVAATPKPDNGGE